MNYPIADAYDRLAILFLKKFLGGQPVDKEIERYWMYLCEKPMIQNESFVKLVAANAAIWGLESDIRLGREGVLGLEEVGRRAIKIREFNKLRLEAKAEIAKIVGEDPDIKIDHASQTPQTQQALHPIENELTKALKGTIIHVKNELR